MATPFEHRYPSQHPAEDLWQTVNTPLTGEIASTVYPWFNLSYLFLDEETQIGEGTKIVYAPNRALVERLGSFADGFPELPFTVEERRDEDRSRVDVLEIEEAQGRVTHRVEEAEDGSSLLVVKGELAIKGFMGSMAESSAIKYALERPAEQLVGHVPEILKQVKG